MAQWNDVQAYLRANYALEMINPNFAKIVFAIDETRSQIAFLTRQVLGEEEWLTVESVVGRVNDVNLTAALGQVEGVVVGGLARIGDLITLKNSMPLANMDINELVRPLELVTLTADNLERTLTGSDTF